MVSVAVPFLVKPVLPLMALVPCNVYARVLLLKVTLAGVTLEPLMATVPPVAESSKTTARPSEYLLGVPPAPPICQFWVLVSQAVPFAPVQ